MQISKIQNPSFKGIHAQTSKMTIAQRDLTAKLTSAVSYSDAYAKAKNMGIDICFFPNGSKNLKARFLDTYSENFVKSKNNRPLSYLTKAEKQNLYKMADELISKLEEILTGKHRISEVNYEKIDAGDTDMNRLFQEFKSYEIDARSSFINSYLNK